MTPFRILLEKINSLNRAKALFKSGDCLLLALSGGVDSTALLYLFNKMKRGYGFKLHAAHLQHGFIKKQSLRHQRFVEKICLECEVILHTADVDIPSIAKKEKKSLEEAGRDARYQFFSLVAQKIKADKIVTAHTLDDLAETMLMRMIRGTGLRGLSGIPYKRSLGHCQIIRPLLSCKKSELRAYLDKLGSSHCYDKSNSSLLYTRNKVRSLLLPVIKKHFNPSIYETLQGLHETCLEAQIFIEKKARLAYRSALILENQKKGRVALSKPKLNKLDTALLREVVYFAIHRIKTNRKQISHLHINAVLNLLKSNKCGKSLPLPGPMRVLINKKALSIDRFDE